jgi:hypothetical protein
VRKAAKLLISLKAANTAKSPLGESAALLYAPRDDNDTIMMFVRFRTTARRNSRMPLIGRSSRRLSRGVAC